MTQTKLSNTEARVALVTGGCETHRAAYRPDDGATRLGYRRAFRPSATDAASVVQEIQALGRTQRFAATWLMKPRRALCYRSDCRDGCGALRGE
jgi:hypothetical protein